MNRVPQAPKLDDETILINKCIQDKRKFYWQFRKVQNVLEKTTLKLKFKSKTRFRMLELLSNFHFRLIDHIK